MAAILDAAADPGFGADVVAVGTDRPDAAGLQIAEQAGVPVFCTPFAAYTDRPAWNAALADDIAGHAPDLVVAAGFMRILGAPVLERHTIVNVHPALLPAFPGAHAVRDALAHGVAVTGATVHFVDEGVDTGPIIDQVAVRVEPGDDEASLHARIKTAERRLLVDAVGRLARGELTSRNRAEENR
ncbi:phosphoribosylglycinamide formyltransferase [Nocardiopsis coralliicola]